MKICIALVAVIAIVFLPFQSTVFMAQDAQTGHGAPEPRGAGVQWARGEAAPGQAGSSPNMTWHGGSVQKGTSVYPIFWGPSWGNAGFVGDKVAGLDAFYDGIGGSAYAGTNTEYTDGSGKVTSAVTRVLDATDLSKPANNFNITTPVLAEVCKIYSKPVAGAYYPVYVDSPRGRAGFCAWHSAGSCNGIPIQFALFFNLDGDAGCDPGSPTGSFQSGGSTHTNSQGLAAVANVSGHELSEMLTDPRLNAWYDSSGAENADKCAWTFGSSLLSFTNGSRWKIQGNWSNTAYSGNTGYTRGCINGN